MTYIMENYIKSKKYTELYDEVIKEYEYRKFKYPAIYKDLKGNHYAVASLSYPCTTEVMADYLAHDNEYVVVYNEALGREILLLSHGNKYYHEFDKINSFLVVVVCLDDNLKRVVYNLEYFLSKDKETDEYRFTEVNNA